MGILERLLKTLVSTTSNIDRVVDKGYNLNLWEHQMMLLHALQIQAQTLIDIIVRAASLLGYTPSTPSEALQNLLNENIISTSEADFVKKVIGFRNIVVHGYTHIDLEIVDNMLRNRTYRRLVLLAEKIIKELSKRGLNN